MFFTMMMFWRNLGTGGAGTDEELDGLTLDSPVKADADAMGFWVALMGSIEAEEGPCGPIKDSCGMPELWAAEPARALP